MKRLLVPAFAAALLAGCAASTPSPGAPRVSAVNNAQQCFANRSVRNYAQQDDRTVNVRVGVNDIYQLELLQTCPDIGFTSGLGFSSRSAFICSGIDVDLVVPRQGISPAQRCAVRSVRRLSPEEAAALPSRAKP